MSRVHDALRRAEQMLEGPANGKPAADSNSLVVKEEGGVATPETPIEVPASQRNQLARNNEAGMQVDWRTLLSRCKTIPFHPAPEAHLIDPSRPHDGAAEEFRALRTRLNHMQGQQDLHVIVVSSSSPAEGKTFTATNLALAQAQLEMPVLLADLDLRRPVVHNQFQCERTPGFSDFLLGEKSLEECIRRIEGTNLYLLPAGSSVRNPLELLNTRQVKYTLDSFRKIFNWVILDTPPLLFSADANLLATITDGIILVVRIGSTTYDNIVRAMQSLCENNVLGIVANGARAGELYSKYTYYYTKTENDGPGGHFNEAEALEEGDEDDDDGETVKAPRPVVVATEDGDIAVENVVGEEGATPENVEPVLSFTAEAPAKKGFFSKFRSKSPKAKKVVVDDDDEDEEDDE